MGKDSSNLSSTGFDYVVAVTQDSINGTLKEFLWKPDTPEIVLCYVLVGNQPAAVDYQTLKERANGTDPFSIPAGTSMTDPGILNLATVNFLFAIKAKLGLPPKVKPAGLTLLSLEPGQSSAFYTMMFAEFVGVQLSYGANHKPSAWLNQSQPTCTFSGMVDLNLRAADFTSLTQSQQNQIKDLGDPKMFSVQQLYYDLNNHGLQANVFFSGLASGNLLTFLTNNFVKAYWNALNGSQGLGYGVTQNSGTSPNTLRVTNINFVMPRAFQASAPFTLNYLCAANHAVLPDATKAQWSWDWIDAGESFDGVAALNRNTFATYLESVLEPQTFVNCLALQVKVSVDGTRTTYSAVAFQGGFPTVVKPPNGSMILEFTYGAYAPMQKDSNGTDTVIGTIVGGSAFSLTVEVQGSQMTIVQHLVIDCSVTCNQFGIMSVAAGNIVDLQITDTYTYGVDGKGNLIVSDPDKNANPPTSVTVDNSDSKVCSAGVLGSKVSTDALATLSAAAKNVVSLRMTDIPAAALQSLVLPGGATFLFEDVSFSENQDLVCHINYINQQTGGK